LVLPNQAGRVIDLDGAPLPGIYATGWVKRGPVGLIGHTKSDAAETVAHLLEDAPHLRRAPQRDRAVVEQMLADKGVHVTDFTGWDRLDAHERSLGQAFSASGTVAGRERVKVTSRAEMTQIARWRG